METCNKQIYVANDFEGHECGKPAGEFYILANNSGDRYLARCPEHREARWPGLHRDITPEEYATFRVMDS